VSPRLALDCVAGYSAPTAICTNIEAIAASRAIMASASATETLASAGATDDEAATRVIVALESDSAVAEAFVAFKLLVGYRMTDSHTGIATAPYLLETPATFLRLLRSCIQHVEACDAAGVTASTSPVKHVSDAATQRVRAEIPGQHLLLFDLLLEEARSCYKLRDERVNYGDAWANGIVRRAMIECGRRGGLSDPVAAVEATHEQLKELITGAPSTETVEELTALRGVRHASNIHFLPPRLEGPPMDPEPPADTTAYEAVLSWLPPDAAETLRRMHRLNDVRGHLEAFVGTNQPGTTLLHGVGISGSAFEGVAVVGVMGIDVDVSSLAPGVILVTQATSSCFNLVCPSLGGLVCDGGSLLSHPAITVREHGIPAVVAAGGCCSCIHTGDRLRIDPDNNTVEILERAARAKM
jgi:phosphohistidine swiveling domain-containing protein